MKGKKTNKRATRRKSRQSLVFEELEPRLLLSADLPIDLPAVLAPDRGDDDPVSIYEEITTTAVTGEQHTARELVFVDTDTPDYQLLIDDLLSNSSEDLLIEVALLDNSRDGIAQITDILAQHHDLDAVHIISHGSEGSIGLGGAQLKFETLLANARAIQAWAEAFSENGDLLIYGCNLTASENGQALVDSLARLTGADVAASDDLTASSERGGDWELEYQTGLIETDVAVSKSAQMTWSGTLEQTLWISTDSNVAAPGADGLPGGWTEGQVLNFGGPTLAHGAATDGDLSLVFDSDTFTTDATDTGALHFVSRDMTVGGGGNTFDLKAGDVLVSFLQEETVRAVYSSTGSDLPVNDQDLLVFRPNTFNDYSSGTFYLLLDEVVTDDLKGVTLVEQDTTIGGTDVSAGSFLLIQETSATTSIDLFVPTGVGAGTTTGSVTPFIDLSDLGIDANRLRGIELIEAATTVGGQALAAGSLLATLNVDDNVSGIASNNLLVDLNDVFVLNLTSTGLGTTAGTATMFLDGSDVGLDDNPSQENPYALALYNYSQLVVDTTSDVSDGDVSSVTALLLDKGADGKISLREAIEAANATLNGDIADVIHFNITDPLVGGAHTIRVGNLADGGNGALPSITDAVMIHGTTDADFAGTPIIELDGSAAGTGDIAAGRRVVLPWGEVNFNIADLNTDGETLMRRSLEWASGNLPPGNLLFVVQESSALLPEDTAKKTLMENWGYSVNVIDVNDSQAAFDAAIASNDVAFITKDISSADMGTKLRNAAIGIVTEELAITDVEFGLNASHGWDTGVLSLTIDDNSHYITSPYATGSLAVFGVAQELQYVTGSQAADLQTLGSTTSGSSLVIIEAGGQLYNGTSVDGLHITAGNSSVSGLVINRFSDSAIELGSGSGNVIQGNYIGTDVTGALDPGNGYAGSGIVIVGGSSNNTVGGTSAGDKNIIANQIYNGVYLNNDAGNGNSILGNTIFNNGGIGIDLVESGPVYGVTANDAGDGDIGANNLQNYPVLNTAHTDGSSTITISGTLDTKLFNQDYRVEFFASASADGSGHGEAERYLGYADVTTDGGGNATINTGLSATVAAGEFVTATATVDLGSGNYGDTSEFSQSIAAIDSVINFTINSTPSISEDLAETATFTVTLGGDALVGGSTASVDITASGSALSSTDYDNFITAIATAAGLTTGVTFDGVDTLTFDSTFNGGTGLGAFAFTVDAIDDAAMEGTETIEATLSNPSVTIGSATFGTFSDLFAEASNTPITAHTPDSGLVWTKVFDNSTYGEAFIDAALGVLQGGSGVSQNNTGQAYTAGPAPTGVDQTISFTLSAIETDNGNKPVGLFGRSTDNDNFYYLRVLPNDNVQDSISLWKMVGGAATQLDTIDVTIADGDTFKLEITDGAKKAYHNGTEVLFSTDNALTAAGTWGFFIGNFNGVSGHYRTTWNIDNVLAEDSSSVVSASTDITETDVNNAPTASNNTVITNEDTTYTFAATDFNFSDIDGDSLSQIQITTLETAGSLELSGVAVTLNQVITAADITAGNLTFTPAFNANGAGYDSFAFQVHDATAYSAAPYTMTVDVTAVNDAPIHSVPAAQSTSGTTPLTFSTLNANGITVADPDVSGATMEVTLSVSNGSLSLSGTSGLRFSAGAGSSDAAMTFTGTAADINVALNGLSFQADAGYEGMATVQIITDDLGNVGTGGALNALDRVNITVTASAATGNAQYTLPPLDELILQDTLEPPTPEPVSTPDNRANVVPAAEQTSEAASPPAGSVSERVSAPVVDPLLGSGRGVATQTDISLPGLVPLFDQDRQPQDDDRRSSVRLIGNVIRQGLVDPFTYAKMLNPLQSDAAIWEAIEAMMQQMSDRDGTWYSDDQVLTTTTATGLTVSFTVGYVSWLLRAGYLSASLLSVLPLWREFDPLPVLATTQKNKRKSADRTKDSCETNDIESERLFTSSPSSESGHNSSETV